jgi:hypothetical protein
VDDLAGLWRHPRDRRTLAEDERLHGLAPPATPISRGAERDCGFGDWLSLYQVKTPIEFIDLAYHAYDAALMAEMAAAIGEADRARSIRNGRAGCAAASQGLSQPRRQTQDPQPVRLRHEPCSST